MEYSPRYCVLCVPGLGRGISRTCIFPRAVSVSVSRLTAGRVQYARHVSVVVLCVMSLVFCVSGVVWSCLAGRVHSGIRSYTQGRGLETRRPHLAWQSLSPSPLHFAASLRRLVLFLHFTWLSPSPSLSPTPPSHSLGTHQ